MYEIGDKVIYQGADKDAYKKVGVLKSIEEKDGKPQLTVEFDDGETFTAPEDDWSREFTNACRNALKVGDRVESIKTGSKGKIIGKPRGASEDRFASRLGMLWYVKFDNGAEGELREGTEIRLANSCASTNSVVANAMAANRRVAKNGESEQREIVDMNIASLKKDIDKVVRGLDETKRWMAKYGDDRIASMDKAKEAVVQAVRYLK